MLSPEKICVLSDSHAVALKQGWTLIRQDFPGTELTFFAGTRTEWDSVHAVSGKLVTESAVLREQFAHSAHNKTDIADEFDVYLVYGIGLTIASALKLWLRRAEKDLALYRAEVARHVGNTNCAHTLGVLRAITAKPILLLASPFQPRDFCIFSPSIDDRSAAMIRATFFEECEALAAQHNAVFFPQPQRTLAANGVTTKMRFANSTRYETGEDRIHCTPEYGALMLRAVLKHGFTAA